MSGGLNAVLYALIFAFVSTALIVAFATGTSTGETTLKVIGPLLAWLAPLFAFIRVMRGIMGSGKGEG